MLKYLRYVRRTGIVLTLIACCVASSFVAGAAPDDDLLSREITINMDNKNLKFALDYLASKYALPLIYSNSRELENSMITVHAKNQPLKAVLSELLIAHSFNYRIIDHKIVIIRQVGSNGPPKSKPVKGTVTSETGEPLIGATIKLNGVKSIITDANGQFVIADLPVNTIIQVSFVGYQTKTIVFNTEDVDLMIRLDLDEAKLSEVSVVSNGYQRLPKERATGSFVQLDSAIVNRRFSTDALSRLEGVVPGLLFNRNTNNSSNGQADISIRGTNTLFANNQPLIVLDNFPYDGNINNINPSDIENITVLKDAAAASIWGVQSGNGVIVITTKKGKRNQPLNINFTADVTVGNKPNLYYGQNWIKPVDFIGIEENLFGKGYYDSDLKLGYVPVTPVVQLLADQRSGKITAAQAGSQISQLGNNDIRNQEDHYLYQKSVNQQYALSLRGGNGNADYFFSLGDDRNSSYYKGNTNDRITINSLFNFYPLKQLQLTAGINYTKLSATTNNPIYNGGLNINGHTVYPYAQIADGNGNSLPIAKDYSLNYTANANNQLLDWNYRPLDELHNADNTSSQFDNRINLGAQYDFLKHLSFSLKYQYEHAVADNENNFNQNSYYARNLINEFSQISSSGTISRPIPVGGILQSAEGILTSQRGRAQLNYNNSWRQNHELNVIAGAEISEAVNESNSITSYGYNKDTEASFSAIDYGSTFTVQPSHNGLQIPNTLGFGKTTDRYISYFANAAYTYEGKYIISASARIDKSNLFGVNTNQKSVPLYSTGLAWNLYKESFFQIGWLPYLKLRATYGYTGNINKSATAVTTISQSSNDYFTGGPYAVIANPGNPELRWEKVRIINLGVDFAIRNNVISGSFEYYIKKGIDLFGNSPLAPSTGLTSFFGNTADTKGNGIDIVINSRNINSTRFKWTSNFSFSHVVDIVTKYDVKLSTSSYISGSNASNIQPLTGKSLYAIYSYQWGGLTHNTGDPQGYLNGALTTDYTSLLSKTAVTDMVYNGSSRPLSYGYLRNTFSYKALSLSANIIYKLDYYFRRSSFISSGLPYNVNTDYYKRWQNPGDELITNVPSFQYPFNTNRDIFYQNSSVLIDKGDHIRLQDINVSYGLRLQKLKRLGFTSLQLFSYINNVAILWRANKDHLDPDLSTNYANATPLPRTIAFGLKAQF